jgi:hypothetical protein
MDPFAYSGCVFIKGAVGELEDRRAGMSTLIALNHPCVSNASIFKYPLIRRSQREPELSLVA